MKTISPTLKAALSSGNRCFLLKIEGNNGVFYGFTNHDKQLDYDGLTYYPAPGLKHLETYYTNSAEVSSSKFQMAFIDDGLVDEELVRSGVFDSASYTIYRIAWDDIAAGAYVHDEGTLAGTKWDENKMKHETHGFERNLAQNVGVIHSPTCIHQFGDQFGDEDKPGACTLNKASFTETSSVSVVDAQRIQITIVLTGQADDFFTNGVLTWTSGDNNGMSVPVKTHTVGGSEQLTFALPTLNPIQVGDTFNVIAGCDKTFEQCRDKFSNTIHFGGHPYMNPGVTRR